MCTAKWVKMLVHCVEQHLISLPFVFYLFLFFFERVMCHLSENYGAWCSPQEFLIEIQQSIPNVILIAKQDALIVEEMIRSAARDGTGFGLDEFTSQGVFNRKFLRETTILVASWEDGGQPIGTMLLGPSAVCRSANLLMNFYLIVEPGHRHNGVGTCLSTQMELLANRLGYEGILLDLYQCDVTALEWLRKRDYRVTGSLPDCGYIKGRGYVDCVLLYKDFHFKSKYWLLAIMCD